jgi:hypothetical protein
MMKSQDMFKGQSDEQIDSYIDQMAKMDPATLKAVISGSQSMQKYAKPAMELYKKLDESTYGFAKYILGALLMIILYFVAIFSWRVISWILRALYALAFGTAVKTPETVDAVKSAAAVLNEVSAQVGETIADTVTGAGAKPDEYEF